MAFDPAKARSYIASVDLKGTPRGLVAQGPDDDAGATFDEAKKQAQVVGSGVFTFEQGVTAQVREAISDAALLAQLAANKKVPFDGDPLGWFRAYAEVLQNIGWTIQEGGWADYSSTGQAAAVHEKILEVVTAALVPSAAALSILTATINALKGLNPTTPWLTIFDRESRRAKIARFQVGLVSIGEADDIAVALLACLIEARSNVTQVLFFKFKEAHATFKASGLKVSVNRASIAALGPVIREKTVAYQKDYLSNVLNT